MLFFEDFYGPLGEGNYVGAAFRDWFQLRGESDPKWFYGLTILGDPTLYLPDTVEHYPILSVNTGPVGTKVQVSGLAGAAAPFSTVKAYWDALAGIVLNQTSADSTGAYTMTVKIPPGVNGEHFIVVNDGETDPAGASFIVTGQLIVSSTNGLPGDTLSVTGHGFAASSDITFTFDSTTLATPVSVTLTAPAITTNGTGSFSASIVIPTSIAPADFDDYTLTAEDEDTNTASATVTIDYNIKITPALGPTGITVTISGRIEANVDYDITFNAAPIASGTTAANGSFTATYTIPGVLSTGFYPVTIVWETVNSRTVTFEVIESLSRIHNLDTGLNYTSIQAAIDAPETLNGHTIFVDAGTYYENVVVTKSLSLIGEDRSKTIIDASGQPLFPAIVSNTKNISITIKEFTLQNGEVGLSFYNQSSLNISQNIIKNNLWGIYLESSYDNIVYGNTLTNNTNYGIVLVESSCNTLHGNNITNNSWGIFVSYSNNNTISDNSITSTQHDGIFLEYSYNSTIFGNIIANSYVGIHLDYSQSTVVSSNVISNTTSQGIYLSSWIDNYNSYDHTVSGNIVTNSSIGISLFYNNNSLLSENIIENNNLGISITESSNNVVSNNNITHNEEGVFVREYSNNNTISNNNLTNNGVGIYLRAFSHFCLVSENNITNNEHNGISLSACCNSSLIGNIISNSTFDGIFLHYASKNLISNNSILNNQLGISLANSSDNTITENKITENLNAMELSDFSFENNIYHNNFNNNVGQVVVRTVNFNIWNTEYPSGGNYWSNYVDVDIYSGPNQDEPGSDGIWDNPYVIDGYNQDNYPLTQPFNSTNVETWIQFFDVTPTTVLVNEVVSVECHIEPNPPSGYTYGGILLTFNKPDGTEDILGPFNTDSSGYMWTNYIPTQLGSYSITIHYPGEVLGEDTYAPCQAGPIYLDVIDNHLPIADANGPYYKTLGESVTFDGSLSSDPDGILINYDWDFDDGNTGNGVNPSHIYSQVGTYNVVLTVTDDDGQTNSDTTTVTISNIDLQRIVFDTSHSSHYVMRQHSDFADYLIANGYSVSTIDPGQTIAPSLFSTVDVLIISTPSIEYSTPEIDTIEAWVKSGGSLLLISDWGNLGSVISTISTRFEIIPALSQLYDSDNYVTHDFWPYYDGANLLSHPITDSVERVEMYLGDGIISGPSDEIPLIITDTDGTATWEDTSPANGVSVMCALDGGTAGSGRLVFIGDSNTWGEYGHFYSADNEVLALNTINWLAQDHKNSYLVVRGSNNGIYYRTYDTVSSSWSSWSGLPGLTPDTPAAAVCGNQLHIVVRGMDGASLYHGFVDLLTDEFSGWSWMSGSTPSIPRLASDENSLYLVVRGDDNRIYLRSYDLATDSWGGWSVAPTGTTVDSPGACVDGDYLYLVVRGMDDGIYHQEVFLPTLDYLGWSNIGGSTPSIPALTSNYKVSGDVHLLYLVVRGSDNGIYLRSYDSSWSGWTRLPGSTGDAFGACIQPSLPDDDACLHIVVRGMDGAMYHGKYDLNSESFLGWSWMSGTTPSPPVLTS